MIYLIIYDTDSFITINAVGIKDCIIQLADYVGDNSPLFQKALKGCDTTESCIDMFNHFSQYTINKIFGIREIIYERSDSNAE